MKVTRVTGKPKALCEACTKRNCLCRCCLGDDTDNRSCGCDCQYDANAPCNKFTTKREV